MGEWGESKRAFMCLFVEAEKRTWGREKGEVFFSFF